MGLMNINSKTFKTQIHPRHVSYQVRPSTALSLPVYRHWQPAGTRGRLVEAEVTEDLPGSCFPGESGDLHQEPELGPAQVRQEEDQRAEERKARKVSMIGQMPKVI